MDSISYNNKKLRMGAALVASVYIVLHGRLNLFLRAIISLGFYIAVAASFIIALVLVYYVHKITMFLDKRFAWRHKPIKRSILQFIVGVVAPSFLDIFFVFIYFKIIGENIFANGFFLIDLPIVISFITILNLYYLIHYLLLTESKKTLEGTNDFHSPLQTEILFIEDNGTTTQFDAGQEILYFYRVKNRVNLFAFNGKEYPVKETLGAVATHYLDCGFLQINRSMVLNFSIVMDYKIGLRRNTLELIFNRKYFSLLQSQGLDRFVVTKEHIAKVIDFFEGS